MLLMPYGLTHSLTTLKDRATQLLIRYKNGALVTQYVHKNRNMTMAEVVSNEICVILSSSSQQTPLEYKVTRVTHLRQTNMLSIL